MTPDDADKLRECEGERAALLARLDPRFGPQVLKRCQNCGQTLTTDRLTCPGCSRGVLIPLGARIDERERFRIGA